MPSEETVGRPPDWRSAFFVRFLRPREINYIRLAILSVSSFLIPFRLPVSREGSTASLFPKGAKQLFRFRPFSGCRCAWRGKALARRDKKTRTAAVLRLWSVLFLSLVFTWGNLWRC